MALNPKQEAFIDYYLIHHSARKAAELAGYPASRGYALKNTPAVREEINARLLERRITADEVLDRLSTLIRASHRDLISFDEEGRWHVDIPKAFETGAIDSVTEIKQKRGGLVEVRKVDTLKSLVVAAKLLGMEGGELSEDEKAWFDSIPDEDE